MQSRGWVHYEIHKPEPHIILFRRELGTDPRTGKVNPLLRESALTRIEKERKMQ
jgi:cyclin-dependent kinase regulatory subunit CKS1